MTSSSNFSGSIQPLSVGNVVSTAFRLYGAHVKNYLSIAVRSVLWVLLPFVAFALPTLFFASSQSRFAWFGLLIPAFIVAYLFCVAKSLANTATIANLAFNELMQTPESIPSVHSKLTRQSWKFLRVQVFVNFLLGLINVGLSLAQTMVVGIASIPLGRNTGVAGLFALVLNLVGLGFYTWFGVRWSIPELSIAVETVTASEAVGRSWELTKGNAGRLITIFFVAGLITLPLYGLAIIPVISALIATASRFAQQDLSALPALFTSLGIMLLLILLVTVFTLPFWQTLKAVIYYDLRSRREGLGLQLRDRGV